MNANINTLEPTETSRSLRVLVVHRYYWPDTPPIAALLRTICERWSGLGHDVSVYTSQPCYKPNVEIPQQPRKETIGNVEVRRCWLPLHKSRNGLIRSLNFLTFLFFAVWHILLQRKKYDVVMCLTFPPVVPAVAVSTAARIRGSRFIYYLLDIHPESSTCIGKLKPGSLSARVATWLDRRSCRLADRVVVLSDDMANTYLNRFGKRELAKQKEKMRVIADFNPGGFEQEAVALPEEFSKPPGKFRLVFAGNLGHAQAVDNLIETARLMAGHRDIEFVFVGEGTEKQKAIDMAGDLVGTTVHFYPHQSLPVADKIIESADLAIVSLQPDVYKVAFPCKTSSYLAMGCPLLVVMEEESELYRMTVNHNLGVACRGNDPSALKQTILRAYRDREQIAAMRQRARVYAESHLVQDALLVRWENLIQEFSQREVSESERKKPSMVAGAENTRIKKQPPDLDTTSAYRQLD